MEYTSMFAPLLIICLTLSLGILIGAIATIWVSARELKATQKELDMFRKMYYEQQRLFNDKYIDKNPDERFSTITGALAR